MFHSVQGTGASSSHIPIMHPRQNEPAPPVSRQAEASLPLPVSAPTIRQRTWKDKAAPIVMGVSLLGLGAAIWLFGVGIAKTKEKDGSPDIPNNFTNASIALFAIFLCLAGVSAVGVENGDNC